MNSHARLVPLLAAVAIAAGLALSPPASAASGAPITVMTWNTYFGFDEGPLPADWRGELARRGIELVEGVLRDRALADFRAFAASNPTIYNGRQG